MSDYPLGATSPPPDRPSPFAAGLSGLCLGPVGTAWNVGTSHALLTGAAYFASTIAWGNRGMLLGLIVAGLYGAAVVSYRNARHDAAQRKADHAAARDAVEALIRPPLVIDAVPVVVELEAAAVLPPAVMLSHAALEVEPAEAVPPAPQAPRPVAEVEPAAPDALPSGEPAAAEGEPPSPPAPPAPRKRGRPKGSRKLAA